MKKNITYLIVMVIVILIAQSTFADYRSATVDGFCYLEDATDHSGTKVLFLAVSASANTDSTYTNEDGSFLIGLSEGIYTVHYSHEGWQPYTIPVEISLFEDTTLDDVTLSVPAGPVEDVSGPQSGIWTSDYIYQVIGDISVNNGDTLIIEPGVTVKFMDYYLFTIYGKLLAAGTETDTIHFTSGQPSWNWNPGDWNRIRFEDSSDSNSVISYSKIEYASYGIFCYFSSPNISNNTISNNNDDGISCQNYSSPTISNNTISYNNYFGISCYNSSSPTISNNTISYNNYYGFDCSSSSSPTISNNTISNNNYYGIYCSCSSTSPNISNNTISNNYDGIRCYDSSSPTISNNTISNNNNCGIIACTSSSVSIINNILYDNHFGIYAESSPSALEYNLFYLNNYDGYGDYIPSAFGEIVIVNANGDPCDTYFNLFMDPLFVDPANLDFHLTESSPCIDAGNPDPIYYDPDGTVADIGAFYFDQGYATFDISGNIGYYSDDSPIPNADVDITGDDTFSATTNTTGDYLFNSIPGGNYISTPSKSDDLGGLSGTDASRIARFAAGLFTLDCLEMIAGDVSMNGYISGTDASRVARYAAGLLAYLNTSGINWVFTPEPIPDCDTWPPIVYENTREYNPLASDLTDEDFIGIRLGDVTGNWSPDVREPLKYESFEITEIETGINSTLRIPVIIDKISAIEGIDICIAFNPEVLQLTELTLKEGILDNKDYTIETNLNEAGKGKMVIYALKDLITEKGTVAFIEFDIIGAVGSKSEIYFTKYDVNETEASGGFQVVSSKGNEIITKRLEANVVETIPEKFVLYQNYPNPFNSKTVIRYDLPKDVHVNIQIYNVRGQLVKELVNGVEEAGRKETEWNAEDMSPGIYFYRLSTEDKTFIKKMVLMR